MSWVKTAAEAAIELVKASARCTCAIECGAAAQSSMKRCPVHGDQVHEHTTGDAL